MTKQPWNVLTVPKGMTLNKTLAECRKHFEVWTWSENLDQHFSTHDRTTKKAYTIEFKPNIEADENLKNLSANDIKAKGIQGITLLERLLLELQYFTETGQHLDEKNLTLCTGSQAVSGRVPYVYWSAGSQGLSVDDVGPGDASGSWRCREVVSWSLNPSASSLVPLDPEFTLTKEEILKLKDLCKLLK